MTTMNPTLEIFSQGAEIVTGQVVDTNAVWLSQQAVNLGFNVTRHTAVGDNIADLVDVLQHISKRADCCICTGGLGPTCDDLTAEAVSQAFNRPLVFDEIAFADIANFFQSRNRPMPECNRKQALLPQGAIRLDNQVGTAPGFALQAGQCWFAFVPGVPSEMRHLFGEHILTLLKDRFVLRPSRLVTIKTVGIGESDLQDKLNTIDMPATVQLGFRAELGEVQTKLLFPSDYPLEAVQKLTQTVANTIGNSVYAIENGTEPRKDLISVVGQLMVDQGCTLALVETVSQGLLASKMAGASWLLNAVYAPSLERLADRLPVPIQPSDLAVTVKAIAASVQKNTGADIVLLQHTSDQSDQSMHDSTTATLRIELLIKNQHLQTTHTISSRTDRRQQQAAMLSLDALRRSLQTWHPNRPD